MESKVLAKDLDKLEASLREWKRRLKSPAFLFSAEVEKGRGLTSLIRRIDDLRAWAASAEKASLPSEAATASDFYVDVSSSVGASMVAESSELRSIQRRITSLLLLCVRVVIDLAGKASNERHSSRAQDGNDSRVTGVASVLFPKVEERREAVGLLFLALETFKSSDFMPASTVCEVEIKLCRFLLTILEDPSASSAALEWRRDMEADAARESKRWRATGVAIEDENKFGSGESFPKYPALQVASLVYVQMDDSVSTSSFPPSVSALKLIKTLLFFRGSPMDLGWLELLGVYAKMRENLGDLSSKQFQVRDILVKAVYDFSSLAKGCTAGVAIANRFTPILRQFLEEWLKRTVPNTDLLSPMTQTEKNCFGAILNLSYESESRVTMANGGALEILTRLFQPLLAEGGKLTGRTSETLVDIFPVALNCFARFCKESSTRWKIVEGGSLGVLAAFLARRDLVVEKLHPKLLEATAFFIYDDAAFNALLDAGIVGAVVEMLRLNFGWEEDPFLVELKQWESVGGNFREKEISLFPFVVDLEDVEEDSKSDMGRNCEDLSRSGRPQYSIHSPSYKAEVLHHSIDVSTRSRGSGGDLLDSWPLGGLSPSGWSPRAPLSSPESSWTAFSYYSSPEGSPAECDDEVFSSNSPPPGILGGHRSFSPVLTVDPLLPDAVANEPNDGLDSKESKKRSPSLDVAKDVKKRKLLSDDDASDRAGFPKKVFPDGPSLPERPPRAVSPSSSLSSLSSSLCSSAGALNRATRARSLASTPSASGSSISSSSLEKIFLLLSRVSHLDDPSPHLLAVGTISTLLRTFERTGHPRCGRLLERVFGKKRCFEEIIARDVVVRILRYLCPMYFPFSSGNEAQNSISLQRDPKREKAATNWIAAIKSVASSSYGIGTLKSLMGSRRRPSLRRSALAASLVLLDDDVEKLKEFFQIFVRTERENLEAETIASRQCDEWKFLCLVLMQRFLAKKLNHAWSLAAARLEFSCSSDYVGPIFATTDETDAIENDSPDDVVVLTFANGPERKVFREAFQRLSPVFAAMMSSTNAFAESASNRVAFPQLDCDDFERLVNLAMDGEVKVGRGDDDVAEGRLRSLDVELSSDLAVLSASHQYLMPDVTRRTVLRLAKRLAILSGADDVRMSLTAMNAVKNFYQTDVESAFDGVEKGKELCRLLIHAFGS